VYPAAIDRQNGRLSDRCNTGGRPGERNFARPGTFALRSFALINTSNEEVLRRRVERNQYTSIAFGKRCKEMGVRPSMGTVGHAYDNAMAESVFASLECELIERRSFKTKTEARLAVFTWIEAWYNPHDVIRRTVESHPSTLRGCTPSS
jgi:integrase-like protein